MALITVDETKCNGCGLCSRACPAGIVVMNDRFPDTLEKIEKACTTCGHCVAACPTAALTHRRMSPDECLQLEAGWRLTPAHLEQLIKGRRSIRRFRPESVDRAVIEKLLDIVRYAPTGMNAQNVQWRVYLDPAELERFTSITMDWLYLLLAQGTPGAKGMLKAWERGENPILRDAPHLIIAHGVANDPAANYSSIIALTTLELAALSFGLGTCWAGFLFQAANKHEELYDALSLPPGHIMYGGLMIGYPEFEYSRIPTRNPARVSWEGP